MRVFFIVVARDASLIAKKAEELDSLGYPYIIVCGEKVNHPSVAYRKPKGKYDAINFGLGFVPPKVDIVALNDADTEIHNFEAALNLFDNTEFSLVFVRVQVWQGPQLTFYSFLDALRRRIPIAASGELMLIRREFLKIISPVKGCRAEDSYILFRILEKRGKVAFCEECFVTTKRTTRAEQEENYKRRTVGGIYQALSMTKPPFFLRLFYAILPFACLLMLLCGRKGYYWVKGILFGLADFIRHDRAASWQRDY